jgi:hypothetical protein
MSAYIMGPRKEILRVPAVLDCLFTVAFNPEIATTVMLHSASVMIAIAATMSAGLGRGGEECCLAPVHSLTPSAIAAEAACTAAAISACGQRCLDERSVSCPTELESESLVLCGGTLLSLSRSFPAARHGILIWLQSCLTNPTWLSSRFHNFFPTLVGLLKVYATYPQSKRDVFEILKLIIDAPVRMVATGENREISSTRGEIHELHDVRKTALFALVDFAAAWHGAPEVLDYVKTIRSIDTAQLRHLVVRVARKMKPPYSARLAHATASLLSCQKAKRAWRNIDTFPYEDQHAIRSLASRIATILKQHSIHFVYLSGLATLPSMTMSIQDKIHQNSAGMRR